MKVKSHKFKTAVKAVKPWYLLVLTIISAVICVYALRANNEHMNSLRSQVYSADKNSGNVEQALQNLAKYVTSNMNTSLSAGPNSVYPPIQLTYSYNRITGSLAESAGQQNSTLYTQAENYCQAEVPSGFSGRYRIPCIEQYITSHDLSQPNIPQSLYEFDFVSPRWSPDLAGWTMLLTILFGILTVVSLVLKWRFKKSSSD